MSSQYSAMLNSLSSSSPREEGFMNSLALICRRRSNATASTQKIMKPAITTHKFTCRKLLGQGIASCSLEELQEIDSQLQRSLGKVRERKEKQLLEENVKLHQKNVINPWRGSSTDQQQEKYKVIDLNLEVETDLFIGLPNRNC
ncbi:AGAMOUS-like 42 [Arabidopsis thaliana]|uniref:AGAMOUS-like 42 n=1 Tax=Arabidopsis thaliana TaxID=3702 RepID=A0A1P8BA55_ARATH|nr:AGAMOUS-like 42 [Arabidopsis thaliana]ANM68469.1 AGAMOUS-like 42 [Arabidopsis thaliana]|eukprot:NP_001330223.1 AGAMOUS-like 42 [Arabidopsis thaliana]